MPANISGIIKIQVHITIITAVVCRIIKYYVVLVVRCSHRYPVGGV